MGKTSTPVPSLLDQHFKEVGKYPLPTKDEEVKLFTQYRKAKLGAEIASRPDVRDQLTKEYTELGKRIACGYLRFVIQQARRRRTRDDAIFADLISEGYLGLMRGVELFDPTRCVRFLTYATSWIMVFQQEYLNRLGVVHMQNHTRKELKKLRASLEDHELPLHMHTPTMTTLENVSVADDRVQIEQEVVEKNATAIAALTQAGLSRLERVVLMFGFGLRGGEARSPEEISQILYEIDGTLLTGKRIDALWRNALARLRAFFEEEGVSLLDVLA
jgi:RNA polymerase sigma factor (sigma-70 family)